MYFASVILLLLILPLASVAIEAMHSGAGLLLLAGKWFVFWSVGVRLFVAGVRQTVQPRFTAEEIFGVRDPASFPIVREIGFGNLSMGFLALASLLRPGWMIPAALAGGLYYGLAGIGHVFHSNRNAKEWLALVSDFFICLVLLIVVLSK